MRARATWCLVVADRCTDATAAIARGAWAPRCSSEGERGARPGSGASGRPRSCAGLEWDAVIMLDADSVIAPGFFDACERAFAPGVDAVQARSESGRGKTLATEASLAAFALQGITLPRGRDRLGLSARLRGTGMAIRRPLALAHRFRAPASEDLVFTLDLILDGDVCRHVDDARLRSQAAESLEHVRRPEAPLRGWSDDRRARVRARAAPPRVRPPRARGARGGMVPRDPPFALATLSLLAGLTLAAIATAWPLAVVFGAAVLTLGLVLLIGLVQARAGLRTWLALLDRPVVPGLEGDGPGPRARQRAETRRLLSPDGPRLRRPAPASGSGYRRWTRRFPCRDG